MSSASRTPGASWITIGAMSASIAIAAGAFGAHALRARLDIRSLEIFETAARYHLIHSLALVLIGVIVNQSPAPREPVSSHAAHRSGIAFSAGILIFCGSLYALSLSQLKILGAITPVGGVAFIIGWLSLAVTAWRVR